VADLAVEQDVPGGTVTSTTVSRLHRWLPACLYAVATAALLLPAFVNRFPLVMGDTWRYLAEAGGSYSWVSSQFYGYFLGLFSGSSLWLVVLVQALLVLFVTDAFFRRICGAGPVQSPVLITLLALTTPVSLFSSLVMTDVMYGVGLVAATVLILGRPSRASDVILAAIVAFAAAAHPAALVQLILVLLGLAAAFLLSFRRRRWHGIGRRAVLAGAIAAALVALVVSNAVVWGNASPNPHSSVVAFAYLLSHGDLEDELAGCSDWEVCDVGDRPETGIGSFNLFLFQPGSILWTDLGGPTAYAPEATEIVLTHVVTDPIGYARRVTSSAARQIFLVRADEHLDWMMARLERGHSELLSAYSHSDVDRFEAGDQFARRLDLRAQSDLGVLVGWLGAVAAIAGGVGWVLAAVRRWNWPASRRRVAAGALLLLGMYVLHSFVIGASTYPAPRYGGRVLWLLGLGFWGWAVEAWRFVQVRVNTA
jgi:hypothetical protein